MDDERDDMDPDELDRRVVPLPRKDGGHRRCPVCRAATLHRFRPFCSQRCADIDLGRWLKGSYSIPTDEAPEGEAPGVENPGVENRGVEAAGDRPDDDG